MKTDSVLCPYCQCPVGAQNIEAHKLNRCPDAPPDIIAARPKKVRRSRSGKSKLYEDAERGMQRVAYAKFVRDQLDSMSD